MTLFVCYLATLKHERLRDFLIIHFGVDRSIFDLKNHNKMDAENCLVCLDILYEPHFALPCQHLFCKLCFRQIESLEIVCPYCRQSIKKWEYNRDKANQIQELHPQICQEKTWWRKEAKIAQKTRLWRNFVSFANYAFVQFIYRYDDNYCNTCVVLDV